ncbi:hypothetical protein [Campylobacter phage DA10]|nr:hypothetical protein [Campylobacter phage DA10]
MKLKDFDFRIWSYNIEEYLQPKNTYLAIVKDEKGLDSYEKVLDVADDCSGHDYPLYQYGDSVNIVYKNEDDDILQEIQTSGE